MPSLPSQIISYAAESPEGTLRRPSALLHLDSRESVDQALSRTAQKGELSRFCEGVYIWPIQTRFGPRPCVAQEKLASPSTLWGETTVPCGGTAANALGLTRQVPARSVCLASAPNRKIKLGGVVAELRHTPRWQLVAPHLLIGDAVRALTWLGP